MDLKVLSLLENSQIENDVTLPFWIYNYESVVAAGKKFIKVYLLNKEHDGRTLELITFSNNNIEYSASNISVVSDFNNNNVIGVAFETKIEEEISNLEIKKEIVDGKIYLPSGNKIKYQHADVPKENEYLQNKLSAYKAQHLVFPQIYQYWWQCSCGRIHSAEMDMCTCGLTKNDAQSIISFNIQEGHIQDAVSSGITFDLNKTFEQNYENYLNKYKSQFGISPDILSERINVETEKEKYDHLVVERNNRQKKKRKRIIGSSAITIVLAVALFIYLFTGNNGLYNKANRLLRSGEYQEAETIFISLDGYKNSNELATESKYLRAEELYNNGEFGTELGTLLKSLNGYKNSKDMLNENDYQIAKNQLDKEQYSQAIASFEKLGDYKDSKTKIKEAKYAYVQAHCNNDDSTTYKYLTELKNDNYSNAKSLYSDLYNWRFSIIVNDNEDDTTTDMSSVNLYGTWYFHVSVSGGTPGESIRLSSYGDFPNNITDLTDSWDFDVYDGAELCEYFWYTSIGSYSDCSGRFTFKLLDSNGRTLATKSVTLK